MNRNNYLLLFFITGLSIVVYTAFIFYRISPMAFGSVVYYCQSFLAKSLEYLPHAGCIAVAVFITIKLFLWRKQMTFIESLTFTSLPEKLTAIQKKHTITAHIKVFTFNEPYAFCYGLIKPAIFISTRLLDLMTVKELEAILLHEQQHINQHDTRLITILRTLSIMLFPFPYFWELTHAYSTVQEISADNAVYTKTGTFTHLTSALRKMLTNPAETQLPVFALPFTGYTVYAARIQAMQGSQISIPLSQQSIAYSLASLAVLSTMLFLPVNKTEYTVNNQHFVVMCYDNQSCEMSCIDRSEKMMSEQEIMSKAE